MIVAEECEVSKEKAETLLRKNRGQVKEAIQSYVRGL
jgi:NACalpha-BTF3-like transcription factor